jgi:hypothetical protein
MNFPNGKFKISSAARPGQYVTSIDNKIVGYSGHSTVPEGAINEVRSVIETVLMSAETYCRDSLSQWLVKMHEGPLFTFEAIRDGEGSGQYIYYEVSCSVFPPSHRNSDLMLPVPSKNGSLILGENPSFFSIRGSTQVPTLS